jgi:hypothetical protein
MGVMSLGEPPASSGEDGAGLPSRSATVPKVHGNGCDNEAGASAVRAGVAWPSAQYLVHFTQDVIETKKRCLLQPRVGHPRRWKIIAFASH